MKILFITTKNKRFQSDFLEMTLLHGLRAILGDDVVDYPRKKIMYHDFSESKKEDLHGRGFTLLTRPIKDISKREEFTEFDFILYGSGHAYGEDCFIEEYDKFARYGSWVIDGHDLYGKAKKMKRYKGEDVVANQYEFSFKRELIFEEKNVYPTGFGIPEEAIRDINLNKKTKLFQKTYPKFALFEKPTDLGGSKEHHVFTNERDYYEDIASSWFGLTSKKGGWDTLRHYEIIAGGALLLFRDYDKKPKMCSPQGLPCYSYSNKRELSTIMNKLIVNNKPSEDYMNMMHLQRKWLIEEGTTIARAKNLLNILKNYKEKSIK